jgi:hypothetical protein
MLQSLLNTYVPQAPMHAWRVCTQMETEEVKGCCAQLQRFLSVVMTSYGEGHTNAFDTLRVHASQPPPPRRSLLC